LGDDDVGVRRNRGAVVSLTFTRRLSERPGCLRCLRDR
jgi:hypothetical protein